MLFDGVKRQNELRWWVNPRIRNKIYAIIVFILDMSMKNLLMMPIRFNFPALPMRIKLLFSNLIPYFVVLEICYYGLLILQFLHSMQAISLDRLLMGTPLVHLAFGVFMLVSITSCMLFSSYTSCVVAMGSIPEYQQYSLVPHEYTSFVYQFISFVLPLVVILKILSLRGLFAKRRYGWRLLLFSGGLLSIIFLLSLNALAFIMYSVFGFYLYMQLKELYK